MSTLTAAVHPVMPEDALQQAATEHVFQRLAHLETDEQREIMTLLQSMRTTEDEETHREILRTINEILHPEIIGALHELKPGKRSRRYIERTRHIGRKIQAFREAKGWTQEKLAEASDLPQSHISRLEKGQHSPSHKTRVRLAEALGVAPHQIDPEH